MGAFGEGLADLASKSLVSLSRHMSETDAGKSMVDLFEKEYIPTYAKAISAETEAASKLPMHRQPSPTEMQSRSRNVARVHTLGRNDALGTAHIAAIAKQPGLNAAQVGIRQQNLADSMHMFLHDTVESKGKGNYSKFIDNARRNKKYDLANLKNRAAYEKPGPVERGLKTYSRATIAPAIAAPHIGTILNYAISTPTDVLAKGLAQYTGNYAETKQLAQDSGALFQTAFDAYSTRWYGAHTSLAYKLSKSPMIGQIAAMATHQPGFKQVREQQIIFGAALGKLNLEKFADRLANNPNDKRALYELKDMGFSPADIHVRKFLPGGATRYSVQLNPDDYKKAVFHFIDSKIFLDNTLDRAFNSQKNAPYRLALMYHGYVTSQAKFLGKELAKVAYKTGDLTLIPQAFATLGVMFPMAGLALKSLEMELRGQGDEAHPIEDEKKLADFSNPEDQIHAAIDGYAHLGAFGVMQSVSNSIYRHELANYLIGPVGNVFTNLVSDPVIGATRAAEGKSHAWDQTERDLLQDSIGDNLGKILAHKFVPNQRERNERNPRAKMHLKGLGGFKKLKMPDE